MVVFNPVKKHTKVCSQCQKLNSKLIIYCKVKLCGTSVPTNKVTTTSNGPDLIVRFVSNGSGRKLGFKLLFTGKMKSSLYQILWITSCIFRKIRQQCSLSILLNGTSKSLGKLSLASLHFACNS